MINYLRFLREKAAGKSVPEGLLRAWFTFPEVKENWLGYSAVGNRGRGLGMDFARALHRNLHTVFSDFGKENITRGSHLERLCLIDDGVGRDNISDFTVNLSKHYLLEYTQTFAQRHLSSRLRERVRIRKVRFNYSTESWTDETFELPFTGDAFVILTPRDILTRDDTWINKRDLIGDFHDVLQSIPNQQLRDQLNNYFIRALPEKATPKDRRRAKALTVRSHPILIEYYIRFKEDTGDRAVTVSGEHVADTHTLFVNQVSQLVESLDRHTGFYEVKGETKEEARDRAQYLKDVIENKGAWRLFYIKGKPIRREADLRILYRLTWFGTRSDVSTEVDNGRGPADYKISRGAGDKTIVEFKLASNSRLKQNLAKQAEVYQRASDAQAALKIIMYFTEAELKRVSKILNELGLSGHADIILVDARSDNKPSASRAA